MKNLVLLLAFFIFIGCGDERTDTDATETTEVTETEETTANGEEVDVAIEVTDAELIGAWVNADTEMGFELKEGGEAASINMATLEYTGWKLDGDKLVLASQSVGVETSVAVDEIYLIREVADDQIVLSPSDNTDAKWTYKKQ